MAAQPSPKYGLNDTNRPPAHPKPSIYVNCLAALSGSFPALFAVEDAPAKRR